MGRIRNSAKALIIKDGKWPLSKSEMLVKNGILCLAVVKKQKKR